MDTFGLLERAHDLGLHLVEICDNLPLHQLSQADLDRLESQAAHRDIAINVGTRGFSRPHLATYLQLCQRFSSPILRVVMDSAEHEPNVEEVVRMLRELASDIDAAGVCLAIENHDRFRARSLAAIMEQVASDAVGICLDTTNSFGALEGPEYVTNTLAPWVVDLHIKDFAVYRSEHRMGFTLEGRPAGQGQLDIPWLLETLRQHDRDPDAILELWPPMRGAMADVIHVEEEWCQESSAYLRTLIKN